MWTGGKFCLRPHWAVESRELSSHSWPCHCNNDSDSCHYQEEEKLKLGCESVGNRTKAEEQQTGRRLMWTVGNLKVDNIKRTVGGPESQQPVLTVIIRAHALSTRLSSTLFSPLLQFGVGQTYLSQVSQCPSDASYFMPVSIQEKPSLSAKWYMYFLHLLLHGKLHALFEMGIMPDFRALTKGSI